jgi:hypothetical protein
MPEQPYRTHLYFGILTARYLGDREAYDVFTVSAKTWEDAAAQGTVISQDKWPDDQGFSHRSSRVTHQLNISGSWQLITLDPEREANKHVFTLTVALDDEYYRRFTEIEFWTEKRIVEAMEEWASTGANQYASEIVK